MSITVLVPTTPAAPAMTTMEPDDTLVARALAGDGGAFGVLWERHRPGLVAVCRRLVADDPLAEDCAQDATLLALLRLDRLRSPDQFSWWLRGIGVRACRRALDVRAGWRRRSVPAETEEAWRLPDANAGMDEALALSDLSRSLRAAVGDLPPGQRAVVACFYLAGMSYQETAAALGIGVGTVKARLHKARAALRARFRIPPVSGGDTLASALHKASKREIAAHEAGHAVLHTLFGGEISRLSIELGDQRRGTGLAPRDASGSLGTAARDALVSMMGGQATNVIQRSRFAVTFGASDRAAAARLASDLTGGDPVETALLVDQALTTARERLADGRAWRLVERVASLLVERQTLDGDEFRALMRM